MNRDAPLATLSRDDLIILFEWTHRFCETESLAFSHIAEVVVIDKLAADLERVMPEPFLAEYPEILNGARQRVLKQYEGHMGKCWVHEQPLTQT